MWIDGVQPAGSDDGEERGCTLRVRVTAVNIQFRRLCRTRHSRNYPQLSVMRTVEADVLEVRRGQRLQRGVGLTGSA